MHEIIAFSRFLNQWKYQHRNLCELSPGYQTFAEAIVKQIYQRDRIQPTVCHSQVSGLMSVRNNNSFKCNCLKLLWVRSTMEDKYCHIDQELIFSKFKIAFHAIRVTWFESSSISKKFDTEIAYCKIFKKISFKTSNWTFPVSKPLKFLCSSFGI